MLLLLVTRPSLLRPPGRLLDAALLLCLLGAAAQLIPLPASARDRVSPRAFAIDRVASFEADPAVHPPHPLTVDVESTAWAAALGAAYIALFWCARAIFTTGGIRITVRGVASLGLALTALVILQRATSPTLLYWTWKPVSPGASPYGPFVNRNSLATWLAMAVPLVIGYAMTRYESKRNAGSSEPVDSTQIWLAGSATLMTGGLLASTSRAGILGGGIGLIVFLALSRRRRPGSGGTMWIAAALGAMVVVAAAYGNMGALLMRMQATAEQGNWGRPAIWRDTWRMVSDFPWTGVGPGAFEHAMLVYQQGSRLFFFNHAHNEYLQILAEGGLLIAVPAALALIAAAILIARQLGADRAPIFWIRAGAAAGLVAVCVQSVWDTGLRTPANGILFAVIAAIAVHQPQQSREHSARHGRGRGLRGDADSGSAGNQRAPVRSRDLRAEVS